MTGFKEGLLLDDIDGLFVGELVCTFSEGAYVFTDDEVDDCTTDGVEVTPKDGVTLGYLDFSLVGTDDGLEEG